MAISTLIENFSVNALKDFFRERINSFKPDEENYDYLFDENDYINENYEDITKIGEADLTNTDDLLIFTAKTLTPLTDRTGKKGQFEIAKKILKEENKDAAFFIFYDDDGNFRFSLIRVNFLGAKRDFTDFKRYTYFVSLKQTNKTFINQISKCDFNSLDSIQEAFSVEPITKQFYEKLQHWYFWAINNVEFPKDAEQETNGREVAIIRLITRLIFIWFMKVRNLIPAELFDEENISKILKDFSEEESTYYKAILQNLFFATLNTKQEERKFRSEIRGAKGYNPDYGNHDVFRYQSLFSDSAILEKLFGKIPFLNGGLFECLDYKTKDKNERKYIDGFTDTKENQPIVPNSLFFSEIYKVDISSFFGKANKTYEVEGLINLLNSYNFTIDENEPDDIEVALDPELLGSIFENLLASYNPETATTARKATGSFYTPREIVNYMTIESLKQYFKTNLASSSVIDEKLDSLINTNSSKNPFDEETTKQLIKLINDLRVVDPAVGSGAFPMAMLNKLVFILSKLDPDNTHWKQSQIDGVKKSVSDSVMQRKLIEQIERQFKEKNADYGRKLYLIEKCIYGVDIQQIAVEIAKLRFFISLLVDEKIDFDQPENNYGIEPLPNLEFKLMQGNSLISTYAGIDFNDKKEEAVNNILFDDDEPYKKLIKEFEELKNEYQNEPDNETKKELRDKIDKAIIKIFEEKISEHFPELKRIEENAKLLPKEEQRKKYITEEKQKLTKKLGFDIEQVEKDLIAYTEGRKAKGFFLWNIYFAEVFSQKGGFDVVIGNPPYGVSIKGDYRSAIVEDLGKVPDFEIYYYFIEVSKLLLKTKGVLSYIIPNTFLFNTFAKKYRQALLEYWQVNEILDCTKFEIFENATIRNSIINLSLSKSDRIGYRQTGDIGSFNELISYPRYYYNSEEIQMFNQNWGLAFYLEKKVSRIITKIKKNNDYLNSSFPNISQGLIAYDKYTGQSEETIKNRIYHFKAKEKETLKPWLWGADVTKYSVKWNKKEYIDYCDGIANPREPRFFREERILIREITNPSIYAALTDDELYNDPSIIIVLNKSGKSIKSLLALLNSKLATFYHFNHSPKATKGAFPKILVKDIKEFPIPKILKIHQKPFEILVDKIIAKKEVGEDTTAEEQKIDLMVYKLYELTYAEVKIVEPTVGLSKEEYLNYKF